MNVSVISWSRVTCFNVSFSYGSTDGFLFINDQWSHDQTCDRILFDPSTETFNKLYLNGGDTNGSDDWSAAGSVHLPDLFQMISWSPDLSPNTLDTTFPIMPPKQVNSHVFKSCSTPVWREGILTVYLPVYIRCIMGWSFLLYHMSCVQGCKLTFWLSCQRDQ